VDALTFGVEVVLPVGVEVVVADDGPEQEEGFGAGDAPA
jgi:hypothetical protein